MTHQERLDTYQNKYTGYAFVTFNGPTEIYKVLREQNSWFMRGLKKIISCNARCLFKKEEFYAWERAAEPTDVYWENLHVP